VVSIEEKYPCSQYAVTRPYIYDNAVCDIASDIRPSARGGLQITYVILHYLLRDKLNVEIMGRVRMVRYWCSRIFAGSVKLQKRQEFMVACPEEIAYRNDLIDADQVLRLANPLKRNGYGQYIHNILSE